MWGFLGASRAVQSVWNFLSSPIGKGLIVVLAILAYGKIQQNKGYDQAQNDFRIQSEKARIEVENHWRRVVDVEVETANRALESTREELSRLEKIVREIENDKKYDNCVIDADTLERLRSIQ